GGVLTHSVNQNMHLIVTGAVEVDATSKVDVSDKGLLGISSVGIYTGGSHGGRGGHYSTFQSGPVYGDYQEPVDVGVGGRNGSTSGTGVTRGGGAIRIDADEIVLDGGIFANGGSVSSGNQGGGAGGSVWLNVGIL